ncbi:MAG: hypothetical protein ACRC7N_17580 [Clostridium sp.]
MKVAKYREKLPQGFVYWGSDLDFDRPSLSSAEHVGTVTKIMNACRNSIVEEDRSIYISTEAFSEILRIRSKYKLKQIISNIDDDDKLNSGVLVNNKCEFIAFGEVFKLIIKEHFEATDNKRRMYLEVSEKVLLSLRDCESLKLLAFKNDMNYKDELKKLKSKRIRLYKINEDELTGELLDKKGSEFHHIRSKASYPKLALKIDNGVIVNKEVHKIITKEGAENEEQLEKLCIKMGWKTSWIFKFKSIFL